MAKSEYVFESELNGGSGAAADKLRQLARTELADRQRDVFDRFTQALLSRYSFLLTDEGPANELEASNSGTSTPSSGAVAGAAALPSASSSSAAAADGSKGSSLRTTKVKVEADLHVTAIDLFDLLTDGERKVPMWSRNPSSVRCDALRSADRPDEAGRRCGRRAVRRQCVRSSVAP